MGDGAPEGLPLIFRFSYLSPALLTEGQAVGSILANGEPLSSSTPRGAGSMRCLSQDKLTRHLLK